MNLESILNELETMRYKARAYDVIETRSEQAREYIAKYAKGNLLGQNIWHIILIDAIQLRTGMEAVKNAEVKQK